MPLTWELQAGAGQLQQSQVVELPASRTARGWPGTWGAMPVFPPPSTAGRGSAGVQLLLSDAPDVGRVSLGRGSLSLPWVVIPRLPFGPMPVPGQEMTAIFHADTYSAMWYYTGHISHTVNKESMLWNSTLYPNLSTEFVS